MRNFVSGMSGRQETTPLTEAQDLMYQAFDRHDPDDRAELARKALELSPDCADAYVLLAEQNRNPIKALELYAQGVAAGERALGAQAFQDDVGHFWGILETRPYMRARAGLAHVLWALGRHGEAIGHVQEMLKLNPNDNQGLRYPLASWLLAEDRDEELAPLLSHYKEPSAFLSYSAALLAFRQGGESPEFRRRMGIAIKSNNHVPVYLLGLKLPPNRKPDGYSPGSEEEAILYIADALPVWKSTPGVIEWLEQAVLEPSRLVTEIAKPIKALGPAPHVKRRLKKLPRQFESWQAEVRQFGPKVEEEGEVFHPWVILVMGRDDESVLLQEMTIEEPTPDQLWDSLVQAMEKPRTGKPRRPTQLKIRQDGRLIDLIDHLEEVGIKVAPTERLDLIDSMIASVEENLDGEEPGSLLEVPGIGPMEVAAFHNAAAEFYRRSPWRSICDGMAIRVECDHFDDGLWYAVLMGHGGMTFGLTLYDELEILERTWSGELSEEERFEETVALTVTYESKRDIPDADLDAIEEFNFEVAGPRAYPTIFRKERGMNMRSPEPWELELMEACLRAIPDFVAAHPAGDLEEQAVSVTVSSGKLDLVLSWLD